MLIGIAGGMCSGKDTVGEYLRTKFGFSVANSSDELRLEMSANGIEVSRVSQRKHANERRSRHGSGYFIQRAYDQALVNKNFKHIAILSFYTVGEVRYFLTELNGRLIGILGPDLKVGYERLTLRSDGSRDKLTYEQFVERNAEESAGVSDDDTNVSQVLSLCEALIPNTGTLQELHESIELCIGGFA